MTEKRIETTEEAKAWLNDLMKQAEDDYWHCTGCGAVNQYFKMECTKCGKKRYA